MDAPTLRANFPEFANTTTYPDAMVNFWLSVAQNTVLAQPWGTLQDQGLQLATAHYITLAAKAVKTASVGGIPGTTQGVVASKAVDKVSLGYDASNVTLEGGGDWNLTLYGIQFLRLARLIGAQAIVQL